MLRTHVSTTSRFSFPTPKVNSPWVFVSVFPYAKSAIGDTPLNVMYSTHSLISRTVPLPKFPFTYVLQLTVCKAQKKTHVFAAVVSTAPPGVCWSSFSLLFRTDSIRPVILICKAAAPTSGAQVSSFPLMHLQHQYACRLRLVYLNSPPTNNPS